MSTEPGVEEPGPEQFLANPAKQYRIEKYYEMGFDWEHANDLADAKDWFGFSLRWTFVKQALEDCGGKHDLVHYLLT